MLTPTEAETETLKRMPQWPSKTCPLLEAHGRILRQSIHTDRDLPPFDRVTMDGYALRATDLTPDQRTFKIQGVQAAERGEKLQAGFATSGSLCLIGNPCLPIHVTNLVVHCAICAFRSRIVATFAAPIACPRKSSGPIMLF